MLGRRLLDRLLPAGPLALAQEELLHLAGRRPRQLAELDGRRRLVAGEVLPAERQQRLGLELLAGLQLDERLRALAPALVRRGDDRRLVHGRVAGEDLLDLDARDV